MSNTQKEQFREFFAHIIDALIVRSDRYLEDGDIQRAVRYKDAADLLAEELERSER